MAYFLNQSFVAFLFFFLGLTMVLDLWLPIRTPRRIALALFCLIALSFLSNWGYKLWFLGPQYLEMTAQMRRGFITALRSNMPTKRLVLGCAAPEDVCARVTPILEAFVDAGWRVRENSVERGFLGRPAFGAIILVHGEGTVPDPDNPNYGMWASLQNPERDTLLRALAELGLRDVKTMSTNKLGENEIQLVFGPQPPRQ